MEVDLMKCWRITLPPTNVKAMERNLEAINNGIAGIWDSIHQR